MSEHPYRLLTIAEACARRGARKSQFYVEQNASLLPRIVKFGRQSLIPENELTQVLSLRAAGASDEEVKALVRRFFEQRQQARAVLE